MRLFALAGSWVLGVDVVAETRPCLKKMKKKKKEEITRLMCFACQTKRLNSTV